MRFRTGWFCLSLQRKTWDSRLTTFPFQDRVPTQDIYSLKYEAFFPTPVAICSDFQTGALHPCWKSTVVEQHHRKQQQHYRQSSFRVEAANPHSLATFYESESQLRGNIVHSRRKKPYTEACGCLWESQRNDRNNYGSIFFLRRKTRSLWSIGRTKECKQGRNQKVILQIGQEISPRHQQGRFLEGCKFRNVLIVLHTCLLRMSSSHRIFLGIQFLIVCLYY